MHKPIHLRLILRSLIIFLAITAVLPGMVFATDNPDEAIYRKLLNLAAEKDAHSPSIFLYKPLLPVNKRGAHDVGADV